MQEFASQWIYGLGAPVVQIGRSAGKGINARLRLFCVSLLALFAWAVGGLVCFGVA